MRGMLAEAALRAAKWNVAIEQYGYLLGRTPRSVEVMVRLGDCYREARDLEKSIAMLEKAIQMAPKSPYPWISMALGMEKAGRMDEAKTNYRKALVLEPSNVTALNNLAFLLAETGGSLEEAQQLVQRGLRSLPDEPSLLDTQAWIYCKKNMLDSALRIQSDLARKHPEISTIRFHYGATLLEKGDRERSRSELQAAMADRPSREEERRVRELLAKIGDPKIH